MTKISIIVPIYKVEKYIRKCVENLKKQTLKDIEIIFVNDGSPDNCGKIVDEFAESDNRIKVIHKENGGVSSARNAGIKVAEGEYIGFVDPDDWIEPEMFEVMYNNATETNSDICRCKGFNMFYDDHRIEQVSIDDLDNLNLIKSNYISRMFSTRSFSIQDRIASAVWLCIFSRKLILDNNILFSTELSMGEDTLFNIEATFHCEKLSICDGVFYHYLQNDKSATKGYSNNLFNNLYKTWELSKSFFERNINSEDIEDRLKMSIINFAIQSIINETKSNKKVSEVLLEISKICKNVDLKMALKMVSLKDTQFKDICKVILMKNNLTFFIYIYYIIQKKKFKLSIF